MALGLRQKVRETMTNKALRALEYLGFLLAAWPLLVLAGFLAFVVLVRASVGHWPSANNPGPWQPEWQLQHTLMFCGIFLIPLTSFCAIMVALGGRLQTREFRCWRMVALTLVSLAVVVVYSHADPGGYVKWFWH